MIDEANLCKYEVLKIIENYLHFKRAIVTNGSLSGDINQHNGSQIVRFHPEFRIFLTQNPSEGNFSSSRTKFP